jgi:hypothetical protein
MCEQRFDLSILKRIYMLSYFFERFTVCLAGGIKHIPSRFLDSASLFFPRTGAVPPGKSTHEHDARRRERGERVVGAGSTLGTGELRSDPASLLRRAFPSSAASRRRVSSARAPLCDQAPPQPCEDELRATPPWGRARAGGCRCPAHVREDESCGTKEMWLPKGGGRKEEERGRPRTHVHEDELWLAAGGAARGDLRFAWFRMRRKGTVGKKIRQWGKKKIKKIDTWIHLSVGDFTFAVPEPNRKWVHPIFFNQTKFGAVPS